MRDTIIISLRGCHIDYLLPDLITKGIEHLRKHFPKVNISLCWERDPESGDLEHYQQILTKKKQQRKSAYPGNVYTLRELRCDTALYRLAKTVLDHNVKLVDTDLPGMNKIPLGDPRAADKKRDRENNMAEKIKATAHSEGGIIIDFGGFNHSARIQRLLAAYANGANGKPGNKPFKEHVKAQHFFCAYSQECIEFFTAEERMMQFTGVNQTDYPYGLKFITTSPLVDTPPPPPLSDAPIQPNAEEQKNRKEEAQAKAEKLFTDLLENCAVQLSKSPKVVAAVASSTAVAAVSNSSTTTAVTSTTSSFSSSLSTRLENTQKDLAAAESKTVAESRKQPVVSTPVKPSPPVLSTTSVSAAGSALTSSPPQSSQQGPVTAQPSKPSSSPSHSASGGKKHKKKKKPK